jgi:AcrR family transcriptional regulator
MSSWGFSQIEQILESFSLGPDESDPRTLKRQRILKAATDLFIHHGYRKTSVDEVARESGVAKGTVYLYFKTKADLLAQAIVEEKKRFIIQLKSVFEAPPRDRLRLYIQKALVILNEMPLMSKLMSGDREVLLVLEEMDADLRQQALGFQLHFVSEMLDAARAPRKLPREELLERAKVLLGLIYSFGVISDERVRQGMSIERFAEILAEIILNGVGRSVQEADHETHNA